MSNLFMERMKKRIKEKLTTQTLMGVGLALAVLLLAGGYLVYLRLDSIWFDVLGYDSVFWRSLIWRFLVSAGIVVFAFLFGVVNLRIAFKRAERAVGMAWTILPALGAALLILSQSGDVWLSMLMAVFGGDFQIKDPQFGLDIGVYIFKLPALQLLCRLSVIWLMIHLVAALLIYFIPAEREVEVITEERAGLGKWFPGLQPYHIKGMTHLGILLGGVILVQAAWTGLNILGLLYDQSGSVVGAGAADIEIRLPGYAFLVVFSIIAAVVLMLSSRRRLRRALILAAAFAAVSFLVVGVLPAMYQQFIVDPNEIARETPYLERSIQYTNMAFGLDQMIEQEFPVGDLALEDLRENKDIIENIRILDHGATKTTYGQQQELRPYYTFVDVDVDRYMADGVMTEVLLAAREMNQANLPAQAKTFNNLMLKYTHGFGLVMSPANQTTDSGMPDYLIKDIPPLSDTFRVTQPRIYFGEMTQNNVIVRTKLLEFDYTEEDTNQEYMYEGGVGIPMTLLNRILLTFRDMQYRYMLSSYITDESLYLETRNVRDRANRIAPFLKYDEDPYLVLTDDGRLAYILDAYTMSSRYPYSQALTYNGTETFNYIRNSVKVTVDAYSGEIQFYIFDPGDPIVLAYQKIYPDLFKSREQMPADLARHIRYPETLFDIQSIILNDYHMSNPVVFYNREDRWAFSKQISGAELVNQQPYYSIIRLPGEMSEEFILMRNYTPVSKQNMVAWLAGRSDGDQYGKLLLYKFPKGAQIPGTNQVESQIDQNPEISSQLSLWGQGGSRVIRGNLLVYPIAGSLLYVEPLYIESSQNQFPQLSRVFVYYKDRIIMETTLEESLAELFPGFELGRGTESTGSTGSTSGGGETGAGAGAEAGEGGNGADPASRPDGAGEADSASPGGTGPGESPDLTDQGAVIRSLIELNRQGKEALAGGDWEGFGRAQAELERLLELLARETPGADVPGAAETPAVAEAAGNPAADR
ncbi:MAG: UPF0182 family protein [Peptococcaceae bacterium]|jgi:uncharacterized membrane protein (UPF0182 family)|nr:UPF0182 family protein [Peptococcaceae bacterium]